MKIAILSLVMSALALPVAAQTDPAKPQATGPAAARVGTAAPQDPASAGASSNFTAEQLEQIVAPIALHPDGLLAQILMASTYPLEIVEAYRWQQKNSSLKDKALEEALQKQDWDPAVKSICGLPSVLKQMNDSLDWTQDLGDAFLGQKEDLMKTVQAMRKKALEAGNLKSSEQQKVSQQGDIVVIESTKTEVVYVPTYYPTAVYGGWSYPYYYYPPMYPPYPTGGLAFGFAVGVAWGGCWSNCNWGGNDVDIDINNQNNFIDRTENTNRRQEVKDRAGTGKDRAGNNKAGGKSSFQHDPGHRKGANYKNPQTAQKYGGTGASNRVTKDQARGYDRSGSKGGAGASGQRPSAGNTPRPSTGSKPRPSTGNAGAGAKASPRSSGGGGSAMSGSRSPAGDRSASSRGSASRGGGGGGGSRGGGGRGGGGGRR